jgi:hypothetical protein
MITGQDTITARREDPMSNRPCESCGLPIAAGPYCQHCVDDSGKLQAFEQRFERVLAWQSRLHPQASREQVVRLTLAYMAAMPAWKEHPRIKAEFPAA